MNLSAGSSACSREPAKKLSSLLVVVAVGVLLLWGCITAARLAYADLLFRQNTLESVHQAVRLVPDDARYRLRHARLLQASGAPLNEIILELEQAVRANPRYSEAWIELGLLYELNQQPEKARVAYETAGRVDR